MLLVRYLVESFDHSPLGNSFHCWYLLMFIQVRALSGFVSIYTQNLGLQDQVIATRVYEAKLSIPLVGDV